MRSLQNYICKCFFLFTLGIVSSSSLWSIDIITQAQTVTASDGTMVAVWEVDDGISSIIEGATFDGISWSAPFQISVFGETSMGPKIQINSLGNVVVGWTVIDAVNEIIVLKAATKLLGFAFTAPLTVSTSATAGVIDFTLFVDSVGPSGNISAVWNSVDTTPTYKTMFSQSPFGGAWSAPIQLR